MKVGEQALYLAQLKGLSKSEAINRLKVLFEKLEVTGWWDKKIEELSKGMAQKVQFITTIVHEPEILIFDEPFSGFDPINANMLKNEILELKSKGATIIFSTHNMASVEELCDEIALINKSKVILDGSVHEIKNKYKKGLFEVHFQGEAEKINNALNNDFNILNLEPFHNGYKAIIKAEADISDNHLLKKIINEVHITNYQEILPSMDEIFISVVQGKDKI